MKIVCESCGAKYSIADEKVAGKVFKIRCKKCSAVIVVKGDQPQDGLESARAYDYGAEAVWHVVVGGEQQGPFAPRQIGELLAEGKIDWEAYVWREGMDGWQPAKDVEDLVKAVMAEADAGEAASSERGSEVFGGSSDMGADPFASSDDGGLAGVIGQSVASATAAGGGADLFADAGRASFAGSGHNEYDDEHPGTGRGPRVSEGQAMMTGQRNENSVLFSLSNLQALATGSGATPSPGTGPVQGEGSGLIDIRALASATQAVQDKPNGSARGKVEDLLAVGSTGTSFSATTLAAPVAVDKPDSSRPVLYGMAAAILALGAAVTYLVVRQPPATPTAQLTPTQESSAQGAQAPGAEAPAAAPTPSAPSEPAAAPQAAEPTPSAAAERGSHDEKDEKEGSVRDEERSEGSRHDRSERSSRRHSHESSSSSSSRSSERAEAAPAPEEPAPKRSTGDKSIDDLLDTALGGKPKSAASSSSSSSASASKPAASESLPATPSREDVLGAMKGVTPRVQACGGGQSGVAMAKVLVAGSSGKVSNVEVSGQFAGTPAAACIAKEISKTKFPRFSQSTFSFAYPFKI